MAERSAKQDSGIHPAEPEPGKERLGEGGAEGVEEGQRPVGTLFFHHIEGQSPRRPVQEDCHLVGRGPDEVGAGAVVPGLVAIGAAAHAPGGGVLPQPAGIVHGLPVYSPVGHTHKDPPTPLCLPVVAAHQPLAAQHLRPEMEAVLVVQVRLLDAAGGSPAIGGQSEAPVCRVGLQPECLGVWWEMEAVKLYGLCCFFACCPGLGKFLHFLGGA